MSQLLHVKDKFGNDMHFVNTGSVRLPAHAFVEDHAGQLGQIRDIKLRSDDVIVVGYPKSGNNWTHHMVSMLLYGTTDLPPFRDRNKNKYIDHVSATYKLPPLDQARALYSHLPFQYLPCDVTEKKVKLVHVTRNPKDVFVSLHCFASKLKPPTGYSAPWPQFFEVMLEEGFWYGDIFEHIKDWEKQIRAHADQPVFECVYEDSKKDTLGQVERLNQFLGTHRSKQLCQAIADACRLENMPLTRNRDDATEHTPWKDDVPRNAFYRKGVVGDWKNWFTVAQNERFDDVYKTKMAGYKRTFTYE